jgi:hAT family C-terminal dimerisation region
MDYLPIQASAVPCERVFSSSAETDTKRRNRISPTLMEALQMLKYDFRKRRLNFTEGLRSNARTLLEDEPDEPEDPHNAAAALREDDLVDRVLANINQEEGCQIPEVIQVVALPAK